MSWLGRIWSKIWVEQTREANNQEKDIDVSQKNEPWLFQTDLFLFHFSSDWQELPNSESDQYTILHRPSNLELTVSQISFDIYGDSELKRVAHKTMETQINVLSHLTATFGRKFWGGTEIISENSWGYHIILGRKMSGEGDFDYIYHGKLSPLVLLNLTFVGPEGHTDEMDKVLASFRAVDEFWGYRDKPQMPLIH